MLIACEKIPIIDEIIDGLFLGDIVAAKNTRLLKEKNIEVVINLTEESNGLEQYHFPIKDNRNENIADLFEKTNRIIKESKGKNVLVHCQNAVSRSVTIVLAYLTTMMTLKEGFYLVKGDRKTYTRPNIGFAKQLMKYEKEMYGKNSISLGEILNDSSKIRKR